jgi:hypothetical protein
MTQMSFHRKGDNVEIKLSDANWQTATVVERNVTGFGTPAKRVTYYVKTSNGLGVMVAEGQIR